MLYRDVFFISKKKDKKNNKDVQPNIKSLKKELSQASAFRGSLKQIWHWTSCDFLKEVIIHLQISILG